MSSGFVNDAYRADGAEKGDASKYQSKSSEGITFGNKRPKLKWILIALLIIVLILALVFIGLYIYERHKPREEPKEYCKTENCVKVSADILAAMNTSVDPCENFYNYACGNWIKKNPIPDSRTSWGPFNVLSQNNEALMKQLILDPEIRTKYSKNIALMKAFAYYDACVNEAELEKLGAQPLQKLIQDLGSWNVTNRNFSVAKWDFMGVFVQIHKYLALAPLFNMHVGSDLKDSTKNIITMTQSGTILPRESYLMNTTYHAKVRGAYKVLMTDLMKLLGAGAAEAEARMEEVYKFEEDLAKTSLPRELFRDTNKVYKKMTLKELNEAVGVSSLLNLTDFLERMFVETGYVITENITLEVYALEYLKNVTKIINTADKRIMANYMMWHVVRTYAPALSKAFVAVFDKYSETVSGTTAKDPRWQSCVYSLDGAFGMAVGLLFVDKTFSGDSKTTAEEMIHDIRNVFIENLNDIDWMDEETKKVAKDKAEAIRENIGYPSYITNATALAKKYEGFDVDKKTLFQNNYNRRKFSNMRNYQQITKPVDKSVWGMSPPTVNAYYSPIQNKIAFPAGILQPPFFGVHLPKSLNYGAIGMVVGHEITHGFDDMGRKFNKEGNLVKWWSNSSIANFQKKTECLVKQYNNYKFHGMNLNGRQTLGENIADNGGLKQAYEAYQIWRKRNGNERVLPGLEGFNNEQMFFLNFAQIWCGAYRKSAAISAIQYGVHSPGELRIIGPLSNFDAFSKAFNCPAGSKMNPKEKCSVW